MSFKQDYVANLKYFQDVLERSREFAIDEIKEETAGAGMAAPDVLYSSPRGTRHMGYYQQTGEGVLLDFREPTKMYQLPPKNALKFAQELANSSVAFPK